MNMLKNVMYLLVAVILFAELACQAEIVFVDAGLENTTINGVPLSEGVNYEISNSIADIWYYRDKGYLAYDDNMWESYASENCEPLVVSVILPTPGRYMIYALAELTSLQDIAVSIDGGLTYEVGTKSNSYYEGAYSVADNFDITFAAKYAGLFTVGIVTTTTANQELQVYVDDPDSGISGDQRTSFDGLGYELLLGAYDPLPYDGETGVDPDLTTSLSWNKAQIDDITKFYLYINDEEDMSSVTPIEVTNLVDPIVQSVALEYDTEYFWRVDQSINDSTAIDPNTLVGDLWSFTTLSAAPLIIEQPIDAAGHIGDIVSFNVTATSESTMHYSWYKSSDVVPSEDDQLVGGDLPTYQVTISESTEAYYYCALSNNGTVPIGSEDPVLTNVVELSVGRILAHYKFEANVDDSAGSENGSVIDLTDPNFSAVPGDYTTGIIDTWGIDLTGTDSRIDLSTTAYPNSGFASGLRLGTVSAWVKTTTITNGDAIISNGNETGSTYFMLNLDGNIDGARFYLRKDDGQDLSISGRPQEEDFTMMDDQWHMVTAAYQINGTCKLYIDGVVVASGTAGFGAGDFAEWEYPVVIGAGRKTNDRSSTEAYLESYLDDLRVYNYILSDTEIADLYLQGYTDKVLCILPYGSEFDTNNDCKINLEDFADFAATWISCGLYPVDNCD